MGLYRNLSILLCLLTTPAIAATEALSVWLDDQTYTLELSHHLPAGMVSKPSNSDHYKGYVVGVEDSWARISRIQNQWEGVVSLNGELYIIDLTIMTKHSRALESSIIMAEPASNFHDIGECGLHTKHDANTSPIELKAVTLKQHTVQQATYSALCSTTVDGVCLLAEIDFVFDQSFQALYPTTYESKAIEMINIVEGYYRNDLNIGFETLSSTFLTSNVFTSSTDSLVVLQDLSAKKDNGSLSFSSKDEALMQLVTARDFDGDTVGVAWLEGLCDTTGYWSTSTTQVVDNIPLTALVSAHEIGHNFGAGHDGTGNSCGAGFIMAPSLNPFASSFSSCTTNYIENLISGLSNQNSCFNYPFDININSSNSSNSLTSNTATRTYQVDTSVASQSINQATLTGNITSGTGSFTTVTIDSSNCNIAGDGQSYSCTLATPTANHNLSVSLSLSDGNYTLTHNATVSQAELSETDTGNNTLTDNFNVAIEEEENPAPVVPVVEPPVEEVNETNQDTQSSNNPSESSTSTSSSGGGGGGSMSTFLLTLISLLSLRRIRASKLG